MVTTRPPKTIVKPTALGPVANTDTKLLIYGLFQKGRVLAQDAVGQPVEGVEVRIAKDGEILVRGPNASCPKTQTNSRPRPVRCFRN